MGQPIRLINREASSEFDKTIEDPLVRGLVKHSYAIICISDAVPEGEFDLLYFSRIMELFLRDRERLANALRENFKQDRRAWGDDLNWECAMGQPIKMINHEAASEFAKSIEDPLVRGLVKHSYAIICVSDAVPEGEFDLLYFFRVMELFLRDREGLANALRGNFEQDRRIWGDD